MNGPGRRVVIIEHPTSVGQVLTLLLRDFPDENGTSRDFREVLETLLVQHPQKLIVDIRCNQVGSARLFSGIRKVRLHFVGDILVLTAEAGGPVALKQISEIASQRPSGRSLLSCAHIYARGLFRDTGKPNRNTGSWSPNPSR